MGADVIGEIGTAIERHSGSGIEADEIGADRLALTIEAGRREPDPADGAEERDGEQDTRVGARPPGVEPGAIADRCDDPAHGGEHVLASPMSRVLVLIQAG